MVLVTPSSDRSVAAGKPDRFIELVNIRVSSFMPVEVRAVFGATSYPGLLGDCVAISPGKKTVNEAM